ncbi:preprotein translocase subunit SecG [Marivita hallyeonensis]|uniref:Protein-export membrane protein SecG n=1 Tax=Marivita hallyeonensis TaxID=996342 RepID=A0A1M5W7P0_9RHOB|nr:preprotein translocase subunit SecG [Marivita hallyeonensis]SHH83506.1 protein translocase subunit secG [Marivita hallyeonensis]
MENVVLIIHLLLALALIGVVLLQRSDSGGLGAMGGGGGGGSISTRSAATGLGKLTWILAIAFICTSLTLTVIAAQNASGSSIMDRLTRGGGAPAEDSTNEIDTDGLLPPPSTIDPNTPLVPRAD